MQTTSFTTNHIIRDNERIATGLLSIRAFCPSTPHEHALRAVYAHILFAGSGQYSREAIQDYLGNIGAKITASNSSGYFDFGIQSTDTALQKTLTLLNIILSKPHFDKKELNRIKVFFINNLEELKEDARTKVNTLFYKQVCSPGDRRYAYDIDETIAAIKSITVADLKKFHSRLYTYPWHLTSGGSKTSVQKIETAIKKLHKTTKSSEDFVDYIPCPTLLQKLPSARFFNIANKQNIEFNIGGSISLTRAHEDYPAFLFGMSVLGLAGGFAGRLMSIVREKEGLTYGIYARIEETTIDESGFWRVSTFFHPKDAEKGATSTIREIKRIAKNGITEDELSRFKTIIATRYALTEDSLLSKVSETHSLWKSGTNEEWYISFKKKIANLTLIEVNSALKTHIKTQSIVVCGVGPVHGVEDNILKTLSIQ